MKIALLVLLLALVACSAMAGTGRRGLIPGQYLVKFKNGLSAEQRQGVIASVRAADASYSHLANFKVGASFTGFGFRGSEMTFNTLKSHPLVDKVEQDSYVHSWENPTCRTQSSATWGLNRVSQRNLLLDGLYKFDYLAASIDSYIIDTGILTTHDEFKTATGTSRAVWGGNWAGDGVNEDCNGHGTHVAGTVGGKTYGLAKNVTLIAVKVLDCDGSGSYLGIVLGMEWVAEQHTARGKRATANMSLGGLFSAMINDAVASIVQAGVVMVVAAGNEDSDACWFSPASAPDAISVGATAVESDWFGSNGDARSSFSNWGTCTHIFAPGSQITSAWIGGPTKTATISGTSMASPHVCGAASLYLAGNPNATPAQVKNALTGTATPNKITMNCLSTDCEKSPNKLLYSLGGATC